MRLETLRSPAGVRGLLGSVGDPFGNEFCLVHDLTEAQSDAAVEAAVRPWYRSWTWTTLQL